MDDDYEDLFDEAAALEREYKWLEAANVLESAFEAVDEDDFLKKGKIQEKIGFCFHWAALQVDKQDIFKEYTLKAIKAYKTATTTFSSLNDPANQASSVRCKALSLYCAQYLKKEHYEIRENLHLVLKLQKNAFELYKNGGDTIGKITHYRDILQTILDLYQYEESKDKHIELADLGLCYSEEAIKICLDQKF